jgi:hypothetical protein
VPTEAIQLARLPRDARAILIERRWTNQMYFTDIENELLSDGTCESSGAPTQAVLPSL